ncbi:hypothetical protein HMPREF3293_01655 [Christensenella minuta]|uniref:Uncharacterized protein n=1 Tax=Christensenella minuta TaxID=626937 RepID=A0A136Q442_9FIRM|nr:hypothetical protein HMPREF3293_01655 [Christensenella minuta]
MIFLKTRRNTGKNFIRAPHFEKAVKALNFANIIKNRNMSRIHK